MSTHEAPAHTAIYDAYALVYDRSGQMRFAIMMGMYLQELLRQHPAPGGRMLDLACGTGTLALLMAEAGWEVTGLDASPAMLCEAHRKQQRAGAEVVLLQGDLRAFSVGEPFGLVTCCYDSLNYLLVEDDLRACVRAVAAALLPGGLFCFDLATEHFLRDYWCGVEEHHDDDYAYTITSSFDEATGHSTLLLDGYVRDQAGREQPLRELHVERAHAVPVVERLLCDAGLVLEAVYDCFTFQPPVPRSLRQFWVVRKPGHSHSAT
ncbi:MAG TPA: class I SAM-dependent methyltransferase [Herpetosiphonaceae bacterium]|jgi:SAM-dependent methyltransferase|nr:class I SAM-dependent methyltransferase [Herpetosiphonaceae bacterium]